MTVPPKATGRALFTSYKERILKEYDFCLQGQKGELLRREGLFTSQITEWRRVIDQQSAKTRSRKRGLKTNPERARVRELESVDEGRCVELAKSRKVIEVQGKLSALLEELSRECRGSKRANTAIVKGVDELREIIGLEAACDCLGIARSSYYYLVDSPVREPKPRKPSPRRLSEADRARILEVCHSERFCDSSVREIYATLLDEDIYLASTATIYRISAEVGETRERRRQATHPTRVKPELLARRPGQVWSWDISKLKVQPGGSTGSSM